MKKFLLVMGIVFCLNMGAAWYWCANDLMQFATADYALWMARKLMLDNCSVGSLAIIGDSLAETSIVPKRVGPDVTNFGLTGSSLITTLEVSKRILACPQPPKAVVLMLGPKRFMGTDMFWDYEVKFNLFPLDLEKVRQRARAWGDTILYEKPSPFDFDMRLKNFLFQNRFPSYFFNSLIAGHINGREEHNLEYLRDTLTDKGYHFLGDSIGDGRIEHIAFQRHFEISGFFETYFGEILDLYASHNIPVYYVAAPFKTLAINVMGQDFKDEYAGYLHHWEQRYPNFHVLGDVFPSMPPQNFSDAVHLNVIGAAQWTAHFGAMMNAAGIDTGAFIAY